MGERKRKPAEIQDSILRELAHGCAGVVDRHRAGHRGLISNDRDHRRGMVGSKMALYRLQVGKLFGTLGTIERIEFLARALFRFPFFQKFRLLDHADPAFERLERHFGKLLGVLLLLLVATVLMRAMFAGALYVRQQMVISTSLHGLAPDQAAEALRAIRAQTFTASLLPGVVAIYLKAALCASVTLFISTFATSSIFTFLISVMVYFIGHVQSTAREYWLASGNGIRIL